MAAASWSLSPFTRYILFVHKKGICMEKDNVNHPAHYTHYQGMEIIQLTRMMSFNLGNAVKYIARAGLKDSSKEIEDLEKAVFYIKDEITWTSHVRASPDKYGAFVGILVDQLPFSRANAVYHVCAESKTDLNYALEHLHKEIEWVKKHGAPRPY